MCFKFSNVKRQTTLLVYLLVSSISLFLNSCDKNTSETDGDMLYGNEKRIFFKVDFNTFKKNVADKDLNTTAIKSYVFEQAPRLSQYRRATQSKDYVIRIDSTEVLMAKKEGTTAFTFKTQTQDMSKTTNYILAYNNEEVDEFYITYDDNGKGELIDPKTGGEVSRNSYFCPIAKTVVLCNCKDHTLDRCGGCPQGYRAGTIIGYEPCGSNGEATGGGAPPTDGGGGESSGGNTGGGSTGDGNNLPIDSEIFTQQLKDSDITRKIFECIGYKATSTPYINSLSEGDRNKVAAYIFDKGCEGNTDFINAAIEAVVKDGEVDLDNEIIKDITFINTKAECVLNNLIQQNGYFKDVMNAFTEDNSEFKIKFRVGELDSNNSGGDGQASKPDANNIVTITLVPDLLNKNALEIAGVILHEGVHAQLHRMLASDNKAKYNLSDADFEWLKDLIKFWNGESEFPLSSAQHDFMSVRYINPIAKSVRNFDSNTHSLENYMRFGWDGLYDFGRNRGLIDRAQLNEYITLAEIPKNDNHKTSCD